MAETGATSGLSEFGKTARGLAHNPLGIIALFIVLVYAIAGIAAWSPNLKGSYNLTIIVWFLTIFPFFIYIGFHNLVVNHWLKLFSPKDIDQENLKSIIDAIVQNDAEFAEEKGEPPSSEEDKSESAQFDTDFGGEKIFNKDMPVSKRKSAMIALNWHSPEMRAKRRRFRRAYSDGKKIEDILKDDALRPQIIDVLNFLESASMSTNTRDADDAYLYDSVGSGFLRYWEKSKDWIRGMRSLGQQHQLYAQFEDLSMKWTARKKSSESPPE